MGTRTAEQEEVIAQSSDDLIKSPCTSCTVQYSKSGCPSRRLNFNLEGQSLPLRMMMCAATSGVFEIDFRLGSAVKNTS